MNAIEIIKQKFDELQATSKNGLSDVRQSAFNEFNKLGIPTSKHEEWKYTRVSSLFNKEYNLVNGKSNSSINSKDINAIRLPGFEEANELVFVNGVFSFELSKFLSNELNVLSLEDAAKNEYKEIVSSNLGHSSKYLKDGINALNTAFLLGGVFINVKKGKTVEHPVYIYNI